MNSKDNICPICGQETNSYMGNYRKDKLCKQHSYDLKVGKIIINDEGLFCDSSTKKILNKNYIEKNNKEEKKYNQNKTQYEKCIICGKDSDGKPLCKSCYFECKETEDEVDRNKNPFELKDYYFNLKSASYRILGKSTIKRNVKMMVALANITNNSYDDSSLITRVYSDIDEIIIANESKKNVKETSYTEQSDSQKSATMRTLDGHVVKSQGEVVVDNILYNNGICHCYEKDVIEISSTDRCLKSDWFIPISGNKGVYLEYWGMDTESYNKNKEEKKKMYKDNHIPLIEIEKDDVKDSSGLDARIMREFNKLKEEIKNKI